MSSCWSLFDIVATLDILSRLSDNLRSLELTLNGAGGQYCDRAVRQASTILDHISHAPEIVGSMKREYIIVFPSKFIHDDATIEACKNLEESLLRCSPHHIRFRCPNLHTRWLFWDRIMSTLFPVLHAKNMLGLDSCGGENSSH